MDSIILRAENLDEAAKQLVRLVVEIANASTHLLCETSLGTARAECVEHYLPVLNGAVRSLRTLGVSEDISAALDAEIARLWREIEEIGDEDAVRGGLVA